MFRSLWLGSVLAAAMTAGSAAAQGPRAPAPPSIQSAVQGQNQDQPVQIEAATLEVRDKSKMATFSGNVQVVQGDTTMKCRTLVVFYGPEEGAVPAAPPPAAGAAKPSGMPQGQNIRRIEARGAVTVVTKDQNASGDLGVYDLKTKTITLSGNVVVSQGQNVMHGERVVVDTTTGNARVESGSTTQSRVRALIIPNKGQDGGQTNVMSIGSPRPN